MENTIDWYGEKDNYIHLKFGDARKMYNFTPEFIEKYPVFAEAYKNYWDGKKEEKDFKKLVFKNPFQIVHYVFEKQIPVHFYYNYTDTPAKDEKEIMDYLVGENSYVYEPK